MPRTAIPARQRAGAAAQGQSHVLEMIASGAPLASTLDALVRVIETELGGTLASILLLDEDGVHLRHGAAPSLPTGFVRRIDGEPIGPSAGSCGTAAWLREAVIVEDIERDPLWAQYRELALRHGLRACWSTPIVDRQRRVLGTFALYERQPGAPGARHRRLIEMATHTATIAILRSREERALRESEARYRALAESSPDAILIHSEGSIAFVNRAMLKLLGAAEPSLLIGRSATSTLLPEFVEPARRRIAELYAGRAQPRVEQVYRRLDGSLVNVEIAAAPMRLAGKPAAHVTVRDISARKRAEEDLRRFRLAMDSSADMIFLIDRGTMRYVDVNPAVTRLLGYSREEVLAMGPQDILPETREALERSYDALIASPGTTGAMNSRYRCKDGTELPFESTRHVLRSSEGWIIAAISRDIRERIAAERSLRESEARYRALAESSPDAILIHSENRVVFANRAMLDLFGARDLSQVLGRPALFMLAGEVIPAAQLRVDALYAGKPQPRAEHAYRRLDGSWVSVEVASAPMLLDGKYAAHVTVRDVTERKLQQQRIERLTRVYRVLSSINALIVRERERAALLREACRIAVREGGFRMAWAGLADAPGRRIVVTAECEVDPAYLAVLPLSLDPDAGESFGLAGRAVLDLQPVVVEDLRNDPRILLRAQACERGLHSAALLPLAVGGEPVGVVALYAADVAFFDAEEMKLLEEMAGDLSFAIEHIEKSEKVDYLALHDPLTGLANRSLFADRLAQSLQTSGERKIGVGIVDIERFKTINDSLGRQAGDEVLKEVARRFSHYAAGTTIARLDRDHFAVMVPNLKAAESAARLTEQRLKDCFGPPFLVAGTELRLSAKVGIALAPDDGTDAEVLLLNAEAALKQAKERGERYLFYTQQMTGRVAERLTLESRLRQALERDEFVLHYQPKLDLESGRIAGLEALIRWRSPQLGLVPPGQFIPLMEETGLILEVGAWALERATLDHRRWAEAGLRPPRVAVNVSAIQLRRRNFVQTVARATGAGAAPAAIDLEITESLVMQDIEANIAKLHEIRTLGLGVAIDDFGTGYSSLAYLAKLPVQMLKVDRSFIVNMLEDSDTMMLVQTIISLAHSLRLKVVAEGVETQEQAKTLRLLRCDQMQGYLVSKPLPFEEVSALLRGSAN